MADNDEENSKLKKLIELFQTEKIELKTERNDAREELEYYREAVRSARKQQNEKQNAHDLLTENEQAYLEKRWRKEARRVFKDHLIWIWISFIGVIGIFSGVGYVNFSAWVKSSADNAIKGMVKEVDEARDKALAASKVTIKANDDAQNEIRSIKGQWEQSEADFKQANSAMLSAKQEYAVAGDRAKKAAEWEFLWQERAVRFDALENQRNADLRKLQEINDKAQGSATSAQGFATTAQTAANTAQGFSTTAAGSAKLASDAINAAEVHRQALEAKLKNADEDLQRLDHAKADLLAAADSARASSQTAVSAAQTIKKINETAANDYADARRMAEEVRKDLAQSAKKQDTEISDLHEAGRKAQAGAAAAALASDAAKKSADTAADAAMKMEISRQAVDANRRDIGEDFKHLEQSYSELISVSMSLQDTATQLGGHFTKLSKDIIEASDRAGKLAEQFRKGPEPSKDNPDTNSHPPQPVPVPSPTPDKP